MLHNTHTHTEKGNGDGNEEVKLNELVRERERESIRLTRVDRRMKGHGNLRKEKRENMAKYLRRQRRKRGLSKKNFNFNSPVL